MLRHVAVGLTEIFGRARHIAVDVSGDAVVLCPETRRALILMGSELVINALKYAFPAAGPGTITVTLERGPGWAEMIVSDDGVGLKGGDPRGQGASLIDRFALLSRSTVRRAAGAGGSGLRVAIRVPATNLADPSIYAA